MITRTIFVLLALIFVTGCQSLLFGSELPTPVAIAPTLTASPAPTETPPEPADPGSVPATWTPDAPGAVTSPTPANLPSITPRPTNTPWPTNTSTPLPTSTPTNTPEATPTALPTVTPNMSGINMLPNPSFEQGWHHVSGIGEVQIPNQWNLGWKEGGNPFDSDSWNRFVRPEARLLNGDFLPADEHDVFIWDGDWTVKVFKGEGAIYFWLTTNVFLDPGSYLFDINVYPDLVEGYSKSGNKQWASDPLSGEVRFIVDDEIGSWILPSFGQKNNLHSAFEIYERRDVRLGVAFRGRWAIENNGWFMDDWSLVQIAPPPQYETPESN